MSQSRPRSALEALTNLVVGFGLAVILQPGLFPAIGIRATFTQSLQSGLAFTALSVVRSYTIRRLFNQSDSQGERS